MDISFATRPSALRLDLAASSAALLDSIASSGAANALPSEVKTLLEQWAAGQSTSEAKPSHLLQSLSRVLAIPSLAHVVAAHFSPLLIDIAARLLPSSDDDVSPSWQDQHTRQIFHSFALLLLPFPQLLPIVSHFLSYDSLCAQPLHLSISSALQQEAPQLLLSHARLLHAAPAMADALVEQLPSATLHAIYTSSGDFDDATKLLAIRALAIQTSLSEAQRKELEARFIGKPALPQLSNEGKAVLGYALDPEQGEVNALLHGPEGESVDVWILPVLEQRRNAAVQELARRPLPYCESAIASHHLHTCARDIAGVLHFRPASSKLLLPPSQRFVVTPGQEPTINCIAQALEQRLSVLITGPPSSGKTSLISHLCSLLHPAAGVESADLPIVTLQLGDHSSLDAKSLLGSYTSSSRNPGTFEWVEGALTRAVRHGKWLVLKDIDKATSEVLSVVKPLVEAMGPFKTLGATPELSLGPRGKVKAASSFRLFALRSASPSKDRSGRSAFPPASSLGNKHWLSLSLPSLETTDVREILAGTFPKLAATSNGDALTRLIDAWTSVARTASSGQSKARSGATRVPTLRDLIKWCRRVEAFADHGSIFSDQRKVERAFVEGAEVFLGNLQSLVVADLPHPCLAALASALGLDAERGFWLINDKTPDVAVRGGGHATENGGEKAAVKVGRMDLPRRKLSPGSAPISRSFALTRPAAQLLERIAASVAMKEPVLLVGETGTGKTTTVQHLTSLLGRDMVALNLSQQTEASDLLGSFKPVEPRIPATELHNMWYDLFETTFSSKRNARFVETERKALQGAKWPRLVTLWKESVRMAEERRDRKTKLLAQSKDAAAEAAATSTKKRRTERGSTPGTASEDQEHQRETALNASWSAFAERVDDFAAQHASKRRNFIFSFEEGPLVKALREGSWVLLDEINLAASETLDSLTSVLNSPDSSVTLFERGDIEPIPRHPDFRLFACMNPATDVGKKDLPANLRSRFTELYVQSPDSDREALIAIVEKYIGHLAASDRSAIMDAAECYTEIKRLASEHLLADGANQRPHYSIRTLARALNFAADQCAAFGLRRALWEGFVMAFTMLLDDKSAKTVKDILDRSFIARARNAKQAATFTPPRPKGDAEYVHISPFWLQTGPQPLEAAEDYILTPSVQAKLVGLARAILARKSPVLIQGPTSAGKTSSVEYLARRTGHRFVRINNHEHTDIQEYLGSYASDPDTGRLVFHEGLLVKALRRGDWIVLDELNLAPTDVLEALNRLLDDNRELIIPETGEVVRPHPSFMLFATQNPPGVYAGRKVLSRAFRNRFLELHFDDVPRPELETILTNRCSIPPSYASKVVSVFVELQTRRQAGRVFDTKQAFVTLRDLFRWGQRDAMGYQQLAENGYMLIAERARRSDDKAIVKEVIESIMNVKIDEGSLYNLRGQGRKAASDHIGADVVEAIVAACDESGIVWTAAMSRLLCLVALALKYHEPVLLVGETGAGKTSACEIVAKAFGHQLHTVSCHQNTDTADLLGGQRPLRNRGALQAQAKAEGLRALAEMADAESDTLADDCDLETVAAAVAKAAQRATESEIKQRLSTAIQQINQASALFEWRDGPLVEAMRNGDHLLLDEISLAEDSVLERLNSVLEPGRTLVLAEKSSTSTKSSQALDAAQITGADGFEVVATMNPGGDYGKKELSPALRNRFTEIWVPQVDDHEDILAIFEAKWASQAETLRVWGHRILDFSDWFAVQVGGKDLAGIGLRDLLAWVAFVRNAVVSGSLDAPTAFAHGAMLALVDGIGTTSSTMAMTTAGLKVLRQHCLEKIGALTLGVSPVAEPSLAVTDASFGIGPFHIGKGPLAGSKSSASFSFEASTSASNALKVLRALHIPNKAILLEGSPGAGKTSLIGALASASGHALTRINLSDQTELSDLFGADLPIEGGGPGEFAWKDAAFLRAMQRGEWVLLDEMNLASQSVLEGLNSCLDHRGSVYIPELGRAFDKHPEFRLFAAQNPHQQGGGRKGLPKSFLNRFTKVFVEELRASDILAICSHLYPSFPHQELEKMIQFNAELHSEVMVKHSFGRQGAPWEFNLRDLLRWLAMIHSDLGLNWTHQPSDHLAALYIQRFRAPADRHAAAALYESVFGKSFDPDVRPWPVLTSRNVQFGHALLPRQAQASGSISASHAVLHGHLPALEAIADCVRLQWMSILVGPSASGKTSLVRMLASLVGAPLEEVRMNSGVDTMDVLGTFEQMDPHGKTRQYLQSTLAIVQELKASALMSDGASFKQLSSAQAAVEEGLSALTGERWSGRYLQIVLDTLAAIGANVATSAEQADALSQLLSQLAATNPDQQSAAGRFEWNAGPLLRAMKKGSWLLLDDANLCSASVLDRLNSLFEPGGSLVLSERGVVDGEIPVVRPHPDFRLFMAIDPQHGELSRAMRNRGLEISLPPLSATDAALLSSLNAFSTAGNSASVVSTRDDTDLATSKIVLHSAPAHSEAFERFASASLPLHSIGLFSRLAPAASRDDIVQLHTYLRRVGVDEAAARSRSQWLQAHGGAGQETFLSQLPIDLGVDPSCWDNGLEQLPLFRLGLDVAVSALSLLRLLHSARAAAATSSAAAQERSVLERYAVLTLSGDATKNSSDKGDAQEIGQILTFASYAQKIASELVFGAESSAEVLELLREVLRLLHFLITSFSLQRTFDYSTAHIVMGQVQELAGRLAAVAPSASSAWPSTEHHAAKLSSGHAMREIWELSMPALAFPEAAQGSATLCSLLSKVQRNEANVELISSAVDLAATVRLTNNGAWTAAQKSEILAMMGQVNRRLQSQPIVARSTAVASSWEVPLLAALQLLSSTFADSHSDKTVCTELYKHSLTQPAYPIRGAIAARALDWTMQASSAGMNSASLEDGFLWAAPLLSQSHIDEILQPFLLRMALFPSSKSRVSMSELVQHRQTAAKMGKLIMASRTTTSSTRHHALRAELIRFVDLLAGKLVGSTQADICGAVSRLQGARDALDATSSEDVAATAQAYLAVASELLYLYLPSVPLDPLALLRTGESLARSKLDGLKEQEVIWTAYEKQITGHISSPMVTSIKEAIREATEEWRTTESKTAIDRKPDAIRLGQLFQLVASVVSQTISKERVADLRDLIAQGGLQDQVIAREDHLQRSLQSLRRALTEEYADLSDLCSPLIKIVDLFQVGFRTLLWSEKHRQAPAKQQRHAKLVNALVSFPTSRSCEAFMASELPVRVKAGSSEGSLAVPMLLTVLSGVSYEVENGKTLPAVLKTLARTYDQLFFIWTADREHERKAAEEQSSLFKSRNNLDAEIPDDEALLEAEFKSMFPEYGDVMDDDEQAGVQPSASKAKGIFFGPEQQTQLWELHCRIFAMARGQDHHDAEALNKLRLQLARSLLASSYGSAMGEALDKQSAAFQLQTIAREAGIDDGSSSRRSAADVNFYLEGNVTETSKATDIVEKMRARLSELIEEWPEQMVLQHIRDRCDAILALDSTSPVAKTLAALEQLLVHSQDWEGYANSSNSLAAHRTCISDQIIAWRRLELSSWAKLLETQARDYTASVSIWWFRIYEVAVRGMQAAVADDNATEHLRSLVSLLDEFIRSATLGDFAARLDLVRAFGEFLRLLYLHAPSAETQGLDKVGRIFANAVAFYSQFSASIAESLSRQRGKIEKDIRDFIKLASWKDVNIHALKQSAAKTHRRLHKSMRQFRDVLRQPVDPMLAAASEIKKQVEDIAAPAQRSLAAQMFEPSVAKKLLTQLPSSQPSSDQPQHLANLARTFEVLVKKTVDRLLPALSAVHHDAIDGLATAIVTQSQQLAKATPALAKEDNEKVIKNLTNRKRKAWTDLLKELRRIGLTPFVNADVASHNQDLAAVYEQALLDSSEKDLNGYFYRLLAHLPRMRQSLHTTNGDLPIAELQRGVSYCEHAMSIVFKERARLVKLLDSQSKLRATVARLAVIGSDATVLPCSSSIAAHVDGLEALSRRAAAALREIHSQSAVTAQLSPFKMAGLQSFRDSLIESTSKLSANSHRLAELSSALASTCNAFWTAEEQELSKQSLADLERIAEELVRAEPTIEALCVPTGQWLASQLSSMPSSAQPESNGDSGHNAAAKSDRLIGSVLVIAQDIQQLNAPVINEEDDMPDKSILEDWQRLQTAERQLRYDEVADQVAGCLSSTSSDLVELRRISPFIASYERLVSGHLDASRSWQRSMLKLTYLLSSLVASLALNGFCKPPAQDTSENAEAGADGQDLEGGTGLGDGTGAQDITDQVEDDEQIEELQKGDDAEEGEKGETQREKGAREAEEDIGGDLEDIEADEGDQDGAEEEDKDGEQEGPDDHVGDVDPLDPNAVDEKIWSGEQDEEQKQGDKDETSKDLDGGKEGQEDSVAKDDGKQDDKAQKESASDRKDDGEQRDGEGEEGEDEPQEGDDGDDGQGEELAPEEDDGVEQQGMGRKLDEQVEDGEKLDIDDDIKMSDQEGGDDDDDGDDDLSDMDLPDDGAQQDDDKGKREDDLPADAPEQLEKMKEQGDQQDGEDEDEDPTAEDKDDEAEVPKNAGEDAMDADDEQGEDADDDDSGMPQGQDGAAMDRDQDAMQNDADPAGDSQAAGDIAASAEQAQGSAAQQGRQARQSRPTAPQGQSEKADAAEQDEQQSGEQEQSTDDPAASTSRGARADQQAQDEQQQMAAEEGADGEDEDKANPIRSLGDALKEFRRNLDSIAEAAENENSASDEAKPDGEAMPEDGEVEHIANDEDAEMQALGAAEDEDSMQKMPERSLQDAEQEGDARPAPQEDEVMQEAVQSLEPAPLPDFDEAVQQEQKSAEDAQRQQQAGGALMPNQIDSRARQPGIDEEANSPPSGLDEVDGQIEEEDLVDPLPEDERQQADEALEAELADFRDLSTDEDRLAKAGELWRSYTAMTSDLAFALCEQLRLILTPTLAARLNGDFRTGKRLNMRKIVPFIASDFAKDKIWLRRTKPSKREYQVLLALDDSRSMADNHSVHLAYQTLALVTGALSRLEVGDVSICRFGESVRTLHPFGHGNFGDDNGAQVLQQLSFEQRGTNVSRLLEHTLESLQEARESRGTSSGSSAADLWQLEIIISDGVCQDHERLRSLLRRASEQRVMIVFIIVDSMRRNEQQPQQGKSSSSTSSSILSMSSVKYEVDPATGKMEIKMDRYLDTFPFSYYVVLREAEALPEVLATTLRQWAEKIREAE